MFVKERILEFLRKSWNMDRIKKLLSDMKKKIAGAVQPVPAKKRRGRITKAKRRQKVKRQLLLCGVFVIACIALIITHNTKASESKKSEEIIKTEQKKEKIPDEVTKKISESEIETVSETETMKQKVKRVRKEAKEKGYPKDIIHLLKKNNETVTFVENYEEKKDLPVADKVCDKIEDGEIPQLLQWDERWGYAPYGSGFVATCGCGPTCMSMVVSGLTKDVSVTPAVVAAYSDEKGYIDEENNTYWKLMQEGGEHWGLSCYEGSVEEQSVKAELKAGHPIICSVGPGDFTEKGHFIVLTKYKKGKVRVNDPFSQKNSDQWWVYEDIKDQIKALWVYSVED